MKLGRRDSATSGLSQASNNLHNLRDSLGRLISLFGSKGLSTRYMVALSGRWNKFEFTFGHVYDLIQINSLNGIQVPTQ